MQLGYEIDGKSAIYHFEKNLLHDMTSRVVYGRHYPMALFISKLTEAAKSKHHVLTVINNYGRGDERIDVRSPGHIHPHMLHLMFPSARGYVLTQITNTGQVFVSKYTKPIDALQGELRYHTANIPKVHSSTYLDLRYYMRELNK